MMKGVIIPIFLVALASAGCQSPQAATDPTIAQVRAPDAAEFDRLWTAVTDVLRDHHLQLDFQDRRGGTVTTHPATAQQFFELWRSDTYGAAEHGEANLQTLRKSAVVQLRKTGEPGEFDLDVQVNVQRISQPERRITSAGGALRLFSEKSPTNEGTAPEPEYWIDLGRDGKLESKLVSEILSRYGQPVFIEDSVGQARPLGETDPTADPTESK
jgi:hypothetical protein